MRVNKRILSAVVPLLVAVYCFLVFAIPVGKAADQPMSEFPVTVTKSADDFTYERLVNILNYLVNIALILAGLVAVGAIVFYGARMAWARGEPAKFNEAKGMLIKACIGATIIFGVYTIIATVYSASKSIGH